jgi:hypothetical protein
MQRALIRTDYLGDLLQLDAEIFVDSFDDPQLDSRCCHGTLPHGSA